MMALLYDKSPRYIRVDSHDDAVDTTPGEPRTNIAWRRRFYYLLACSTTIMLLLASGIVYTMGKMPCPTRMPGAKIPYSPAPLSYINRYLHEDPDTPKFMGQPRPELDQAWHDLLDGTLIRLTEEDLLLSNNATSIKHKDGGYVGGLGISHSLHCLKRIKQYLHPDYYYGHEDQDWDELYSHADHCLESLRQELLCNADISVYTLKWAAHKVKPIVKDPQPHACVDWKALHGWMQGRASRLEDMVRQPESV